MPKSLSKGYKLDAHAILPLTKIETDTDRLQAIWVHSNKNI